MDDAAIFWSSSMDEVVAQAIANVRAALGDTDWFLMAPRERTALIYQEIRRLDLERVSRQAERDPAKSPFDQSHLIESDQYAKKANAKKT
jgi:hypothetical protein